MDQNKQDIFLDGNLQEPSELKKASVEQEIVWVDGDSQLEQLCEKWESSKLLAVDTEFIRTDTYYPIAGLVQINDGFKNYLIDPKAINDFFPLSELFDKEQLLVALHSCSEDLEVFHNLLGSVPRNIVDTQIACALVGYGFSIGYARAIKIGLGTEVQKSETRSDWLARPLSKAQLFYAAMDVEYLYKLSLKLKEDLENLGRWEWLLEDCEQLKTNFKANQNADKVYLRIKSAWRLNVQELSVLQKLAKWREEQAQIRDIPRNRIIKEHALLDLAQKQPKHISDLRHFDGVTERMIKSFGHALIDIIQADNSAENDPEGIKSSLAPIPGPLNSAQNKALKKLRADVQTLADENDLPPEILIKKKEYEQLIHARFNGKPLELPLGLHGWREEIVGGYLLNKVDSLSI